MPNALPVIAPEIAGPIGGIETRSWLLAQGLAQQPDVRVTFVVRDAQPPARSEINGVRIVTLVEPFLKLRRQVASQIVRTPRFPWLRILRWSPDLLWRIPLLAAAKLWPAQPVLSGGVDPGLKGLAPQVFCTFGVNSASESTVATAREMGVPSVFLLGSDGDLDERFLEGAAYVNQYGDRGDRALRILQQASVIVAQTPWQLQQLETRFGRTGVLLPNPIDAAAWEAGLTRAQQPAGGILPQLPSRFILWIGRADHTPKQPLAALELARRVADIPWVLVLNPFDAAVEAEIHRTCPPHVRIIPRVPPAEMPALFTRAAALVNTSTFEGFPNTFLQAALSKVPIISLHLDPRSPVSLPFAHCAGGSIEQAVALLQGVLRAETPAERLQQLRAAVLRVHDLPQVAGQFRSILQSVIGA